MRDWIDRYLREEKLPEGYRHTIESALLPLGGRLAARIR